MAQAVLIAAAISAILHACWNMLAQQHSSPRDFLNAISIATATMCVVAVPMTGLPPLVGWPWIIAAALCNVLYLRAIGSAYAHPNFCAVYAIVRAIVPAIMFLAGWLLFGEAGRIDALLGLTIVALSVVLFAVPKGDVRHLDSASLRRSIAAGLLLAMALLFDVNGIHAVGTNLSGLTQYAVASSFVTAGAIIVLALVKRTNVMSTLVANRLRCYAGAVLLLMSYLCGMWAYAQGPISLVAPVRESGILFSGVLAVVVLRRQVTGLQWSAMILALVGVCLIQVG